MHFDVTVEIPRGQRNKYEVDHETGRISLDRMLFTSMMYPADYGFIESTLAEDGDPLDALVLLDEPTFPGCLIKCRAIALFEMADENGPDTKIIVVPASDPRYDELQDLSDLSDYQQRSIQHFFEEYKTLEPGKVVISGEWRDRSAAQREITQCANRAKDQTAAD